MAYMRDRYSKLSSDTEIPKETIRRFVQVLEDTLLAFRIPAFVPRVSTSGRVLRKQRFDNGVEAWPVIEALEALR